MGPASPGSSGVGNRAKLGLDGVEKEEGERLTFATVFWTLFSVDLTAGLASISCIVVVVLLIAVIPHFHPYYKS